VTREERAIVIACGLGKAILIGAMLWTLKVLMSGARIPPMP